MTTTVTTRPANGLRLLEAVNYDRFVFASIVSLRDDWEQVLDSIPMSQPRRVVAAAIYGIREALGLQADYALDICQGRE